MKTIGKTESEKWLARQKSGSYKANLKSKVRKLIVKSVSANELSTFTKLRIYEDPIANTVPNIDNGEEDTFENWHNEIFDEDEEEHLGKDQLLKIPDEIATISEIFGKKLAGWALLYNVNQSQLRSLLEICNSTLPDISLPKDPRTLLKTPRLLNIVENESGEKYWYYGLANTLQKKLESSVNKPMNFSLLFNIDGLPIYKSSKAQFWPIMYRIHELPNTQPSVISIFAGNGKKMHYKTSQ